MGPPNPVSRKIRERGVDVFPMKSGFVVSMLGEIRAGADPLRTRQPRRDPGRDA
jgi:hypothetical protein